MTMRKMEYPNGTKDEVFSTHTEIFWEPVNNSGMIRFRTMKYTYVGDTPIASQPHGMFEFPLAGLLTRSFTVETPDGPVAVPGMLVMAAMKEAFDVLYNEANAGPEPVNPE